MLKRGTNRGRGEFVVCIVLSFLLVSPVVAQHGIPQGTAFTYQGRLTDMGGPADGLYDFTFTLLDDSDPAVAAILGTEVLNSVLVTEGLFTVTLDFGNLFNGEARWLQIHVAQAGDALTELVPTQPVHSSPYSLVALEVPDASITSAKIADGNVTSSHLNSTGISAGLYGSSSLVPRLFIGIDGRIGSVSEQAISITGDNIVDGSVSSADLNITGVSSGLYGSATQVPRLFIGIDGRIGSVSQEAINITGDNIVDGSVTSGDLNITGVSSGLYGSSTHVPRLFIGIDGRIGAVTEEEISIETGDDDWAWSSGTGLSGNINRTGKVSIGTDTAPAGKLLLYDSGNAADLSIEDSSPTLMLNKTAAAGNAGISFQNQGVPVGQIYHSGSNGALYLSAVATGGAPPDLVLSSTGLVGINTVPSNALFEIDGRSTSGLPVVDIETTFSGMANVTGIEVTAIPDEGYGYGIHTRAGNRAIFAEADGEGRGTSIYGGYMTATGTAGQHYGLYSQASGSGSTNYGIRALSSGATINYSGHFTVNGAASSNTGIYADAEGATTNRGGYFVANSAGTSNYGVQIQTSGATTNRAGFFTVSGAATSNYGLDVSAGGATTNRGGNFTVDSSGTTNYGIQGAVGGATTNYGCFFTSAGAASNNYGVRAAATGAGENHGGYFTAGGAGSTNYGLYASAFGATDNWAGYFDSGNVFAAGNVAIGSTTIATGYKLSVDGKIMCEELKVQASVDWPDFVFHENYDIMSLQELEKRIQEKGHLPGIPSAREVASEGISVGALQAKLLEKIELLTLYVIQQAKENEDLKKEIAQLRTLITESHKN